MKKFLKIFSVVLSLYIVVSLLLFLFQDRIIFQSDSLPRGYAFTFDQKFEEFFVSTEDGNTLNVLLFKTQQSSKGLILYFHGNANNLQRWGKNAIDFTQLGYDVLMVEFRGYGKSTGIAGEKEFYSDAQKIFTWAKENIPHTRLIFYGRSLGCAVASNLATFTTPDLLILETPFDELTGVVYPLFKHLLYFYPLNYKFPNKDFLPRVKCRKIIIHGTDDKVVPLSSALKLKPLLQDEDTFVIIDGGGHKNLREFPLYHQTIAEALK